jgi:hypothetical protein
MRGFAGGGRERRRDGAEIGIKKEGVVMERSLPLRASLEEMGVDDGFGNWMDDRRAPGFLSLFFFT